MSYKKTIASVVAAAALSTSAFSADYIAKDGTGEVLLFPAYFAYESGSWKTDLRVVNTNTTSSVYAKVVVRESKDSLELLDFPIYLSPGDVWEAQLVEESGTVYIVSNDDSQKGADQATPASIEGNAVKQPLFKNGEAGENFGYVEVWAVDSATANNTVAWYNANNGTATDIQWQVNTPLDKIALMKHFDSQRVDASENTIDAVNGDMIYGQEVVSSAEAGAERSMTLMATAYEGVNPDANGNYVEGVRSNVIGVNTTPTAVWNGSAGTSAGMMDAAEKDSVYVTYYNDSADTVLLLTNHMKGDNRYLRTGLAANGYNFATGHYLNVAQNTGNAYYAMEDAVKDSSNLTTGYKKATGYYMAIARDNMEKTLVIPGTIYSGTTHVTTADPCVEELCSITVSDSLAGTGFKEGYVDYIMYGPDSTGTTKAPLPVTPTVMSGVMVGTQGIINMYNPAYAVDSIDPALR